MTDGIMEFARNGQLVIVTPFTLARHGPDHHRQRLALAHANAVWHHARTDRAPGHPVMYGSFTSNVDTKSGSPAFVRPSTPRRPSAPTAGAPHPRAVALLERDRLELTGRPVRLRVADEPVGRLARRL
jgi:trimethylamine--corrinoid protein Co-methyltransferase